MILEDSFQNQFGGCYLGCKGERTRFRDLGWSFGCEIYVHLKTFQVLGHIYCRNLKWSHTYDTHTSKAIMCCLCGTYMTRTWHLKTHWELTFLHKNTCSHVSTCSSHPTWEQSLGLGTLLINKTYVHMLETFLKHWTLFFQNLPSSF
jgi:hypothetical protein